MTIPPDSAAALSDARRSLRGVAERTQIEARTILGLRSPGAVASGEAGVDGVGITLLVGGVSVFAGSNSFTQAIDEVQYGLGEGPCLTAVATRRVVTSNRIGSGERRWSRFSPRAATLALRSVASAPIGAYQEVIGSLNLYSRSPSGLKEAPPNALRRLVDTKEAELTNILLLALAEAGALHLTHALDDRAAIERAVGFFMDRYTIDANQARTRLAQLARHDGTTDAVAARKLLRSSAPDGSA